MGWPNKFFAATKELGVYETSNFSVPETQPVYGTLNEGLDELTIRQFGGRKYPLAGLTLFALTETSRILYRRGVDENWASILTSAAVQTLVSETAAGTLKEFWLDPSVAGRIWAIYEGHNASGDTNTVQALYSDDYGDTWAAATRVAAGSASEREANNICAYGDTVFAHWNSGAGHNISYSANKGTSWTDASTGAATAAMAFNLLQTTLAYYTNSEALSSVTNAGVTATLQASIGFGRNDAAWFSATDADHHRSVSGGKIHVTTDSWANVNTPSAISPAPLSIAPWFGSDEDQIGVELTLQPDAGPTHQPHVIGVLYGEDDVTAVGIAGANCGTAPFTDSIPDTCGGLAIGGFLAIEETTSSGPVPPTDDPPYITPPGGTPVALGGTANVQAVTMPGYAGTARGEPLPGDRGAFMVDTDAHAALHASDILAAAPTRHNPAPGAAGTVPMSDGSKYVATDVLTPTEHTAIGNGTPHHAAVTLGAGNDAALALSGQELTLTMPALDDHAHAGVAGDGGTFDAANLTSGAADDGQVLTADGLGGAAWENPPAGGAVDAADVTYTPAVATDWDADADPGDADQALDQLAERVDDLENVAPGTDANAIHDNVAGEIHAIASKATPVDADELVIEDSADSWNKKRVAISALPAGGGAAWDFQELTDGANIAWDLANGNGYVTLGGNRELDNPTNMTAGAMYWLKVIQDGTGGRTLTYGTAYKFPLDVDPTLSDYAAAVDVLLFTSDGTNMYGLSCITSLGAPLPFDPNDIADLSFWAAARLETTFSDNDDVDTWSNQVNGGTDATQATEANRAIYKPNIINGEPVLRFDGSNDDYVISGANYGSNITLFLVIKPDGTSPVGLLDTGPGNANVLRNYSAGNFEWHDGAPSFALGLANTNAVLLTLKCSLATTRAILYRKNGSVIGTYTNGSTTGMTWANPRIGSINAGGAGYYDGDLAEKLIWGRALTDDEITSVEGWLNGIYGLW